LCHYECFALSENCKNKEVSYEITVEVAIISLMPIFAGHCWL